MTRYLSLGEVIMDREQALEIGRAAMKGFVGSAGL